MHAPIRRSKAGPARGGGRRHCCSAPNAAPARPARFPPDGSSAFSGARNLAGASVPDHLWRLRSCLRRRPADALFPFPVTGSTIGRAPPFEAAGSALVGMLMTMAVLEHWFMRRRRPSRRRGAGGVARGHGRRPRAVPDARPVIRIIARRSPAPQRSGPWGPLARAAAPANTATRGRTEAT
ncbi:MAG: DUF3623 family protein [Acetobacteraceae bacterium]|nr:DUF3623 family protein [Acetobacteraceae bacterium]